MTRQPVAPSQPRPVTFHKINLIQDCLAQTSASVSSKTVLCNPPAKPLAPCTFGLIQNRITSANQRLSLIQDCPVQPVRPTSTMHLRSHPRPDSQRKPAPRSQPRLPRANQHLSLSQDRPAVSSKTAIQPNHYCLAQNRILRKERPAYSHVQAPAYASWTVRGVFPGSPRLLALQDPSHSHNRFGIPC